MSFRKRSKVLYLLRCDDVFAFHLLEKKKSSCSGHRVTGKARALSMRFRSLLLLVVSFFLLYSIVVGLLKYQVQPPPT
jgi:hypothetical protein